LECVKSAKGSLLQAVQKVCTACFLFSLTAHLLHQCVSGRGQKNLSNPSFFMATYWNLMENSSDLFLSFFLILWIKNSQDSHFDFQIRKIDNTIHQDNRKMSPLNNHLLF
jgi:hypothetical protein